MADCIPFGAHAANAAAPEKTPAVLRNSRRDIYCEYGVISDGLMGIDLNLFFIVFQMCAKSYPMNLRPRAALKINSYWAQTFSPLCDCKQTFKIRALFEGDWMIQRVTSPLDLLKRTPRCLRRLMNRFKETFGAHAAGAGGLRENPA